MVYELEVAGPPSVLALEDGNGGMYVFNTFQYKINKYFMKTLGLFWLKPQEIRVVEYCMALKMDV